MSRQSIPANLPREDAFMVILGALHTRWRLVIFMPLVYLLGGAWIYKTAFADNPQNAGYFPLSPGAWASALVAAGVLAFVLWIAVGVIRAEQYQQLKSLGNDPEGFLATARRFQLLQFSLCDLIASPGVLLFLVQGRFAALATFAILSQFCYLRCMPSDQFLGEAMFRGRSPYAREE